MKIRISTRVVLMFEDYVLKFPVSLRGHLQCIQEKYIWEKYHNTGLLGELISYKYGIIKMKKYNPCESIDFLKVMDTKKIIKEFDFKYCDLYNYKNWGKSEDGKIILIDYGINEDISKMYNI